MVYNRYGSLSPFKCRLTGGNLLEVTVTRVTFAHEWVNGLPSR